MTVRVVSYNLLVPIYANLPGHYFKCQGEHLQTDYRWNLIQSQLEDEIAHHKNTVVCLQEVSLTLLPKLELFFRRHDYTFFHNLYGQRYNDYMGVGMAIPMSMSLNSIHIIKLGDHLQSMSKPREQLSLFTWGWNLYKSVLGKLLRSVADPWETAITRGNTLICLEVLIEEKPFCIGTYHMPCLYKQPDVMAIHSCAVKDLIFQLAAGKDLVLAGDFNIKPSDVNYHALIDKDHRSIQLPDSSVHQISYQPNREQVLKSAYREKTGNEPSYTNYSHTPHSPNFCATLDYIFYAGQLTVDNILELPDHPTGESYPDQTHPSDHLMIAATFRF